MYKNIPILIVFRKIIIYIFLENNKVFSEILNFFLFGGRLYLWYLLCFQFVVIYFNVLKLGTYPLKINRVYNNVINYGILEYLRNCT